MQPLELSHSLKLNNAELSSHELDPRLSSSHSAAHKSFDRTWCCPCMIYFDWLVRPWRYWAASWVSWYIASGIFWGSICYAIGSFASITPAVYNTQEDGDCMGDLDDWLQGFVFLLGDFFWISAVSLQLVEALNIGHEAHVQEWEARGRYGTKPRYQWLGARPGRLQWWGALSYVAGMILYLIGDVSTVVNDCPNTFLSDLQFLWLISYFNIVAGFLFGVAGALYIMGESSIWLIPGIFVPFNDWAQARSLKYWGLWAYFWAGWLFCVASLQNYWWNTIRDWESDEASLIITGVGFGGGSILFVVGSFLLLARLARGRCKPVCGRVGRIGPDFHPQPRFNNTGAFSDHVEEKV